MVPIRFGTSITSSGRQLRILDNPKGERPSKALIDLLHGMCGVDNVRHPLTEEGQAVRKFDLEYLIDSSGLANVGYTPDMVQEEGILAVSDEGAWVLTGSLEDGDSWEIRRAD
jgi:hypothetical protein